MAEETEQVRVGWKQGIITHASDDGHIMAIEIANGKALGRRFPLSLCDYRAPVPSRKNFLDWGKNFHEKEKTKLPGFKTEQLHKPARNENIYFEVSADNKIVGWCSRFDFLKGKIEAKKKFNKKAA